MGTLQKSLPHSEVTPATTKLPGVQVPIRAKIALPYFLLAIFIALGAAYLVTQIVFDNIEMRFNSQLIEAGRLASEWLVREEDRMLQTERLLANTDGVAEAIQAQDVEGLRALTFGIVVNNQEEEVNLLDAQGNLLFTMRHKPNGLIEEYNFSQGGGDVLLQWDFVRQVIHQQTDQLGSKFDGLIRARWGDVFYVAGPVYDQEGQFAGAVLVGKTMRKMVQQVREETLAQVSIYDLEGKPIATTLLDSPQPVNVTEVARVLAVQDTGSLKRSPGPSRSLEVASRQFSELLSPWEMRGKLDLGVIGIALMENTMISTSQITRIQITGLVAVVLVLVILVGVNIATLITRPLLALVKASSEVAQGNLSVQVNPHSNDEIAVLTTTFNGMITNLNKSRQDLLNAYDMTLEGWSKALEMRDQVTEGHTRRVTQITMALAEQMGIQPDEAVHIRRGAILHDIGKMGIPDAILNKQGPLTPEERLVINEHPILAYNMLWPIEYLRPAVSIPYCHHERWDGQGYPRQLQGQEIPLAARIFAVVDVWDALINDRPYHKAFSQEEALKLIIQGRGTQFDSDVVDAFITFVTHAENISPNSPSDIPPQRPA